MAEQFRFYKIGEANAEIKRLEGELSKATSRITELETSTGANETELAKQLTEKDSEISKLSAEIVSEKKAHSETKTLLEKANAQVAELPAKIKAEGAKESQRILASLGHDPMKIEPSANAGGQPEPAELKGIARTRAAFQAQFDKNQSK